MGLPGPISGSPDGHIWKCEPADLQLSSASVRLQPRCAPEVAARPHTSRAAARWRHGRGSVCRLGPLQIRVCGKRGGAETRPGRGEDGPAGQTDRGPGGRRAAHCSHVPPGSAGSRARGFRHAPQVGPRVGDREGQAWDPGQAGPRARAGRGASSGAGAPGCGWRLGL